jgi:hypothetical protein
VLQVADLVHRPGARVQRHGRFHLAAVLCGNRSTNFEINKLSDKRILKKQKSSQPIQTSHTVELWT